MKLLELFNSPSSFDIIDDTPTEVRATFEDPDGNQYMFDARKRRELDESDPRTWVFGFNTKDTEGTTTTRILGGRKSLAIFSAFMSFMKSVIASKDADEVFFGANSKEPSRVRMYNSYAKHLSKALGWNLLHRKYKSGDFFIISRPDVDQSRW